MSNEMIGNFVYLYFIISTIALIKWGCDILDNIQEKRENGKEGTEE
jgi:hypothetical protein